MPVDLMRASYLKRVVCTGRMLLIVDGNAFFVDEWILLALAGCIAALGADWPTKPKCRGSGD